jgi:hypothetical protein
MEVGGVKEDEIACGKAVESSSGLETWDGRFRHQHVRKSTRLVRLWHKLKFKPKLHSL